MRDVEDLEGGELDALVAQAIKAQVSVDESGYTVETSFGVYQNCWAPSTDWGIGGKIIEIKKIALIPGFDGWMSECTDPEGRITHEAHGDTPLVAAMRVYVISRLGGRVEDAPEH